MFRALMKNKDTILQTAKWLAQNGEGNAAKKLICEVLKENPQDKATRALYATTVWNPQDKEKAAKDLEKSLPLNNEPK